MRRPLVLLGWACTTLALAGTAWYLAVDRAAPSWDDAWYLEVSFRLFWGLKRGLADLAAAYVSAFRIKAPLLTLLPLPLYAVFGASERVAYWVNLPLATLGAWAWSRAAATWWEEHPRRDGIAAVAAALTSLLPLGFALSRRFYVETLLTALLGLWAWRCAAARPDERREGARLGLLMGLGFLAKVTFPLFALALAWPARERLRPHVPRALLIGGVIASTWYVWNLPYVLGFAWKASFGSVAKDYVVGSSLSTHRVWLETVLRHALSWPLAIAMAAVLASAVACRRARLDAGTRAALWGLAPLAVYALSPNQEARLVSPILPLLGALSARAALSFESPAARAAASILLLGAGSWTWSRQTFLVTRENALDFSGTPSADPGWDRAALVHAVAASGGRVAAVAIEDRRLNANNLSSLAAARDLDLRFVNLGYAQTSAEAALIRLKDKSCDRLILVDGVPSAETVAFLNRANDGVGAAVRSGRIQARPLGSVPLAPGVTASLWELATISR